MINDIKLMILNNLNLIFCKFPVIPDKSFEERFSYQSFICKFI